MADTETIGKALIEWEVDPTKAVKGVQTLAKEIRAEQKLERDLDVLRKELKQSTDALTQSQSALGGVVGNIGSALKSAVIGGNLYSAAIGAVVNGARQAYADLKQYSQMTAQWTGNIEDAREATRGYASDLDIMTARSRMNTLGLKLSSTEFAQLLGHVTNLSSAMGRDMASALEDITTGLSRQSSKILDNIGVVVKSEEANQRYADSLGKTVEQLTDAERSAAFQAEALRKIKEAAEQAGPPAERMSGTFTKLWNAIKNTTMEAMAWADQAPTFEEAFLSSARSAASLEDRVRMLTDAFEGLDKAARRAVDESMDEAFKEMGAYLGEGETAMGGGGGGGTFGALDAATSAARGKSNYSGYWAPKDKRAGGRGRKRQSNEFTKGREITSADITRMREEESKAFAQPYIDAALGASSDKFEREQQAYQKMREAEREADQKLIGSHKQVFESYKQQNAALQELAVGGLGQFTAGLWSAADAAIMGQESTGMAVAKMTKDILLGIATQSTVLAIFEVAEALRTQGMTWGVPNGGSINHWAAAAKYGIVAGVAGTAGLAVSAGIGAAGGYGGGESARSRSESRRDNGRTAEFGRQVEDNKPINVQVYIQQNQNGSMMLLGNEKIKNAIKLAA